MAEQGDPPEDSKSEESIEVAGADGVSQQSNTVGDQSMVTTTMVGGGRLQQQETYGSCLVLIGVLIAVAGLGGLIIHIILGATKQTAPPSTPTEPFNQTNRSESISPEVSSAASNATNNNLFEMPSAKRIIRLPTLPSFKDIQEFAIYL